MSTEQRLKDLGYELTKGGAPAANYLPANRCGDLVFISGQVSANSNGVIKGLLGDNMDVEAGQKAAETCAVSILSHIVHSAGIDLDDIKKIAKLTVLVASIPDFPDQHLVANGASDLLVNVLGEKGKHARAAFGVSALPLGAAVEIEAIIEV